MSEGGSERLLLVKGGELGERVDTVDPIPHRRMLVCCSSSSSRTCCLLLGVLLIFAQRISGIIKGGLRKREQ